MIIGSYECAYCGKENEITVEPDPAAKQVLTEDCQICCRPNKLTITWVEEKNSPENATPQIVAEPEANLET